MNKEELKNCPFCNERPNIESKFTGRKGVLTIVKCPKCRAQRVDRGFRSSIVEMEDRAVRQWNTQYAQSQTESLKKEIEELKKKTEWISVKERLPNDNEWVLCVIESFMPFSALYKDNRFRDPDEREDILEYTHIVTHWMPLPTPPNQ